MKKYKGKIIGGLLILSVLMITYFWGGNYAKLDKPNGGSSHLSSELDKEASLEEEDQADQQAEETDNIDDDGIDEDVNDSDSGERTEEEDESDKADKITEEGKGPQSSEGVEEGSEAYSKDKGMVLDSETGKDKYLTDPVPEGKPLPVEPEDSLVTDKAYTCTLSVRCDTILDNIDYLDPEKLELVPEDGVIFSSREVTFYEGESVFNLLQREMKKNKIHMEFRNTPIYNSAYIMGINNLYEFDVGELSGWMYKVNGWFPNYGVSRYKLDQGDVVEFVYTCDLGRDVGGYHSLGAE